MLIEKLTDAEMAKVPDYYNKWNKIGMEYRPIDKDKAKTLLNNFIGSFGYPLNHYFYFDSPLACQIAINVLNYGPEKFTKEYNKAVKKGIDILKPPHSLMINLSQNLMRYLPTLSKIDVLGNAEMLAQYISNFIKKNKLEYHSINWYGFSGNLQAGYCAFYEFFIDEVYKHYDLDVKISDEHLVLWEKFKSLNEEMHIFWVFDDIAICSEKPTELHFENNRLHNFNGPACRYADGYELYYMRGVRFDEEIVKSKPEDLDIDLVIKEENAEKRFVLAEKIGLDRILDNTDAKVIEYKRADDLYRENRVGNYYQHGDVLVKPKEIKEVSCEIDNLKDIEYKLVELKMGETPMRYLIMTNPSQNTHKHIEGVPNEIETVAGAIFWRNEVDWLPYKLS